MFYLFPILFDAFVWLIALWNTAVIQTVTIQILMLQIKIFPKITKTYRKNLVDFMPTFS